MNGKLALVWLAAAAVSANGQSVASRVTSKGERDLLTELVAAEDTRGTPTATDVRRHGLTSNNAYLRAFTVRGLGRLENAAVIPAIATLLGDPSVEVRVAAADALAQAAARAVPAGADAADRAVSLAAATSAREQLVARFAIERDPAVRAALLEAIGRLNQGSVDQVKATANLIAPSLSAAAMVERRGAIRGLFFLARKREARAAGAIPSEVTDRMYAMLSDPASAGYTPTDRYNIAFALVGALAMNDARTIALSADRDPYVRDRAVAALPRATDTATVRTVVQRAMVDPAPVVRFRSIGVYGQKLRPSGGCGPLINLTRDSNTNVALAAIDALSACRDDATAAVRLEALASGLRDGETWHLPAHALASLSSVDSARARALLPRYMAAANFFVRMYADTAARLMGDVASLYALARDAHPNVRASAIDGLSGLVGHAADSIYLAALESDDNQLLMSAAAALKGASHLPAVSAVRERLDRSWRETARDGREAVDQLWASMGGREGAGDRRVHRLHSMRPPSYEVLAEIERAEATIEMMDGSIITMRFHPFDAPANASRFVHLARAGAFDGLTFHRVAPFFVVQGPGPNANEYSAPDSLLARDELGVSNVRGAVGLSTRGRDTADGQIYVNTVDNVWLDHEYTVMATITSGLAAFDRMQEGARIRKVTVSR